MFCLIGFSMALLRNRDSYEQAIGRYATETAQGNICSMLYISIAELLRYQIRRTRCNICSNAHRLYIGEVERSVRLVARLLAPLVQLLQSDSSF